MRVPGRRKSYSSGGLSHNADSPVYASDIRLFRDLHLKNPTATKVLTKNFPLFTILLSFTGSPPTMLSLLGFIVIAVQRWAFFLNPHFRASWRNLFGTGVQRMLYETHLAFYDSVLVSSTSLVFLVVAVCSVFLLSVAVVVCVLLRRRSTAVYEEKGDVASSVARVLLQVMSTVLLIPMMQACFASLACDQDGNIAVLSNSAGSAVCWTSSHLLLSALAVLCLIILLPILYIKSVCVYDDALLSTSVFSLRYSVMQRAAFARDVVSCSLFNLILAEDRKVYYVVLQALMSALLVYGYMYHLPYYSMRVNRACVMIHSAECFASLSIASSLTNGLCSSSAEVAAVVFIGLGSVATCALVFLTDYRVNSRYLLARERASHCSHKVPPAEDPRRPREPTHLEGCKGDAGTRAACFPFPDGLTDVTMFCPYSELDSCVLESVCYRNAHVMEDEEGSSWEQPLRILPVMEPYVSSIRCNSDVILAVSFVNLYARKFGSDHVSAEMLLFAVHLFSRALAVYPDDAHIIQSFTAFALTYLPDLTSLIGDLVQHSSRVSCTFEQRFRALKQVNELRVMSGSKSQDHKVRCFHAYKAHNKVMQLTSAFWSQLTKPLVDIEVVSDLTDRIWLARDRAIKAYDVVLRNQVNADPVLLHHLGDFFMHVAMDPEAARTCYDEAQDCFHVQWSRSAQGTCQYLTEVDVMEVNKRFRELLRFHRHCGAATGKTSLRLAKRLAVVVTIAFIITGATVGLFIYTIGELNVDFGVFMDSTTSTATLRQAGSNFASIAISIALAGNKTSLEATRPILSALEGRFTEHLNQITVHRGRRRSRDGEYLLLSDTIPYFFPSLRNRNGYSLFSLSELYLQAMDRFLNTSSSAEALPAASSIETFTTEAGSVLNAALARYSSLTTASMSSAILVEWVSWFATLLALSISGLLVAYASFNYAFIRTSLARVSTIQLFTLIPYESLEKFATETKERFRRMTSKTGVTRLENGDSGRGVAMRRANVDRRDPFAEKHGAAVVDQRLAEPLVAESAFTNVATAAATTLGTSEQPLLHSCTKGTRGASAGPPSANSKRVTFNPQVIVICDAESEAVQEDAIPVSGDVDGDDDGDGNGDGDGDDAELSALIRSKRANDESSASSARCRASRDYTRVATFLYISTVLLCATLAPIALGFLLHDQQEIARLTESYHGIEVQLNAFCFAVPDAVHHTLSFLRTGATSHFQFAQERISEVVHGIPQMMGRQFPLASTRDLVRMHALSLLIGNLTLDASILAARHHGVVLPFWPDVRSGEAQNVSQAVAVMVERHKVSASVARRIYSYMTPTPLSEAAVLAYVVLMRRTAKYMNEFRALHFKVLYATSPVGRVNALLTDSYLMGAILVMLGGTAAAVTAVSAPAQRLLSKHLNRRRLLAVFLCFLTATCCYLGFLLFFGYHRFPLTDVGTSRRPLHEFSEGFLRGDASFTSFMLTAQPRLWFDGAELDPIELSYKLSRTVLSTYRPSDSPLLFQSVVQEWAVLRRMNNISAALVIHALREHVRMEAPMEAAMQTAYWNCAEEPDYLEKSVRTAGQNFYTNKTYDFSKTAGEQYATALDVGLGSEYMRSFSMVTSGIRSLLSAFIEIEGEALTRFLRLRELAAKGVILVSILPLGASLWMVVGFGRALIASAHSVSFIGASDSLVDAARFKALTRWMDISFLVVAVLFAVTVGFGMRLTQAGCTFTRQLSPAIIRASSVSTSLYKFRKLLLPRPTFTSSRMVWRMLQQVTHGLTLQLNPSVMSASRTKFFFDASVNEKFFGVAGNADKLHTMTSFLANNCSRYLMYPSSGPLPVPQAKDYVGGLTQPVMSATMSFISSVPIPLALWDDLSSVDSSTVMAAAQSVLSPLSSTLLDGLVSSYDSMKHVFHEDQRHATTVIVVLAVVTLGCVLAVYCGVVIPAVRRIARGESTFHMLLHMVPAETRMEVPAIVQYMELGHVPDTTEFQRKFEVIEKLLQNIMPPSIASRLKSGEQPIADCHDCVTILFTDFVGFTKRSSSMQAKEIVDFLNEVFLEFDSVVELCGLEKIKTIGDAFFVAGGLNPLVHDHALRVVEAALMFFEALDEHNRRHPSRAPLQMRLGIHSGPVVAGVIGVKKVAYDLWGESLEIANAMETNGVPGFAHISEATAKMVRGYFRLQPRGELSSENDLPANMPPTYLVVGRELPTPYMHFRRPRLIPVNFTDSVK